MMDEFYTDIFLENCEYLISNHFRRFSSEKYDCSDVSSNHWGTYEIKNMRKILVPILLLKQGNNEILKSDSKTIKVQTQGLYPRLSKLKN